MIQVVFAETVLVIDDEDIVCETLLWQRVPIETPVHVYAGLFVLVL